MSKHISSPLAMGKAHSMAPKMESPMEKELVGKQNSLPEGLKKAIEASPAEMHGAMHMDKGAPTKMYGGKKGDDSKSKKDYESPAKMYGGKKGDDSKSRKDYK